MCSSISLSASIWATCLTAHHTAVAIEQASSVLHQHHHSLVLPWPGYLVTSASAGRLMQATTGLPPPLTEHAPAVDSTQWRWNSLSQQSAHTLIQQSRWRTILATHQQPWKSQCVRHRRRMWWRTHGAVWVSLVWFGFQSSSSSSTTSTSVLVHPSLSEEHKHRMPPALLNHSLEQSSAHLQLLSMQALRIRERSRLHSVIICAGPLSLPTAPVQPRNDCCQHPSCSILLPLSWSCVFPSSPPPCCLAALCDLTSLSPPPHKPLWAITVPEGMSWSLLLSPGTLCLLCHPPSSQLRG